MYVVMHNPASGQWELARVGGGRVGAPFPGDRQASTTLARLMSEMESAVANDPEHFGARPELNERFPEMGS